MSLKGGENLQCWLYHTSGLVQQISPFISPDNEGWLDFLKLIIGAERNGFPKYEPHIVPVPDWAITDRHVQSAFCDEEAPWREGALMNNATIGLITEPMTGPVVVYRRET